MENLNEAFLSQTLGRIGFKSARDSNISKNIKLIHPSGSSSLRDSLMLGSKMILKFKTTLSELDLTSNFIFVHVIISHGKDNSSSTSLSDLSNQFSLMESQIPRENCLTIFIGIDSKSQAIADLKFLKNLGEDTCEVFSIDRANFDEIFKKISLRLKMHRLGKLEYLTDEKDSIFLVSNENKPDFDIHKKRFAVVLNMDISRSMAGGRFNALIKSIKEFYGNLDSNDFVLGIVFNDQVNFLDKFLENQGSLKYDDGPSARCYEDHVQDLKIIDNDSHPRLVDQPKTEGKCCCVII